MTFGTASRRVPVAVPLQTAIMTWIPIALGIVLGTIARLLVFVLGGGKGPAAAGSILCVGLGTIGAVLWLRSSGERSAWRGVLRLSLTWVVLTILFRALWIGAVLGGGWPGVQMDYHIGDGQPALITLAIVACVPLLMVQGGRDTRSTLD